MTASPVGCIRGCLRVAYQRGLCGPCHHRLVQSLKASGRTLADAEAAGECLPARDRRAHFNPRFEGTP